MDDLISQEELSQPGLTLYLMMKMVCSRPKMWVGDDTFRTVVVYLNGYDAAVANLTGKDMLFESDLVRFGRWLSKTMVESSGLLSIQTWFICMEALYPDDKTRLRQLPLLFSEYLREHDSSGAAA